MHATPAEHNSMKYTNLISTHKLRPDSASPHPKFSSSVAETGFPGDYSDSSDSSDKPEIEDENNAEHSEQSRHVTPKSSFQFRLMY